MRRHLTMPLSRPTLITPQQNNLFIRNPVQNHIKRVAIACVDYSQLLICGFVKAAELVEHVSTDGFGRIPTTRIDLVTL